jgi:hypothetical protein
MTFLLQPFFPVVLRKRESINEHVLILSRTDNAVTRVPVTCIRFNSDSFSMKRSSIYDKTSFIKSHALNTNSVLFNFIFSFENCPTSTISYTCIYMYSKNSLMRPMTGLNKSGLNSGLVSLMSLAKQKTRQYIKGYHVLYTCLILG